MEQEEKEKLKKLEQELQRLYPSWPQYKARWMATKMLIPNQEQKWQ